MTTSALLGGCATDATQDLPDPLAAGWQGESVCEVLQEDQRQRILRCTFPPGVGHEQHFHAPHWGYVIAGGRMQIDDSNGRRVLDVPTGHSWLREETTVHEIQNIGDTTSVYLIVEVL